MFNSINISFTR